MNPSRPQLHRGRGTGDDPRVMVAASSRNMNLYYSTRFLAGDPIIFIDRGVHNYLVVSELEVGRARAEALVDEILDFGPYRARAMERGIASPHVEDVLVEVLLELGFRRIRVPHDFPLGTADRLRAEGIDVTAQEAGQPFVPGRVIKSEDEIDLMRTAMRANEAALRKGIDTIAAASIEGDLLFLDGEPLSSETVRAVIDTALFTAGYLATRTIVAGGDQACDPHAAGSGLLPANTPIIIDVFPRSMSTRYCADMTRTVVRGKATERVRAMYDAVRAAQELVFDALRAGVDGSHVHARVEEHFRSRGFRTGPTPAGKMEGFFHGTGHGLGLEIHELPAFGKRPYLFESGMVVTVEPGLYYPGEGGVRLEDVVVIRDAGIENLCTMEKVLEV